MENKDKLFTLGFTEKEIAIIKAGLQYCFLNNDFGYALWGTMPGATFGSRDWNHSIRVNEIYKKLHKVLKVKPDYGEWGGLKHLVKLYKKEIKKAEKEGEELEKRLHQDDMTEMEQLRELQRMKREK